jgi:hypothetical protein
MEYDRINDGQAVSEQHVYGTGSADLNAHDGGYVTLDYTRLHALQESGATRPHPSLFRGLMLFVKKDDLDQSRLYVYANAGGVEGITGDALANLGSIHLGTGAGMRLEIPDDAYADRYIDIERHGANYALHVARGEN